MFGNVMETLSEQDKQMMTFIEGLENGGNDFFLGVDVPTQVYKAKFEKNDGDLHVEVFCARG